MGWQKRLDEVWELSVSFSPDALVAPRGQRLKAVDSTRLYLKGLRNLMTRLLNHLREVPLYQKMTGL